MTSTIERTDDMQRIAQFFGPLLFICKISEEEYTYGIVTSPPDGSGQKVLPIQNWTSDPIEFGRAFKNASVQPLNLDKFVKGNEATLAVEVSLSSLQETAKRARKLLKP